VPLSQHRPRSAGDQQLLRAPSTTSRLTNIAVLELGEPEQRSEPGKGAVFTVRLPADT
jgi:hypothetical protein